MQRCSFLASVVEVELPSKATLRVRIGAASNGFDLPSLMFDIPAISVRVFIAGDAVECNTLYCFAVLQFSEETGFVRLRSKEASISAFLSSELNLEMQRMLLELLELGA